MQETFIIHQGYLPYNLAQLENLLKISSNIPNHKVRHTQIYENIKEIIIYLSSVNMPSFDAYTISPKVDVKFLPTQQCEYHSIRNCNILAESTERRLNMTYSTPQNVNTGTSRALGLKS